MRGRGQNFVRANAHLLLGTPLVHFLEMPLDDEVVSKSIKKLATCSVDWLSIPDEHWVIDDDILEWLALEVKAIYSISNVEDKENLESATKYLKMTDQI